MAARPLSLVGTRSLREKSGFLPTGLIGLEMIWMKFVLMVILLRGVCGVPGRTGSKWTILIVFSGLESGAAAHNKLGEFLTFASAQNCAGCRLCQLWGLPRWIHKWFRSKVISLSSGSQRARAPSGRPFGLLAKSTGILTGWVPTSLPHSWWRSLVFVLLCLVLLTNLCDRVVYRWLF